MKIKVILGSIRENRFGDKPANWIMEKLSKVEGVEAELLDLRDYPMPMFAEATPPSMLQGAHSNPIVQKWADKISEADGFIIVTPEYNHSFSSALKNAIDYLFKEWNHKAVGFVSYGSVAGGSRAVEQLRQVVAELHMASVRNSVIISNYWSLLDEKGNLKDGALEHGYTEMISQLLWWTEALKTAREKSAK